MDWQQILQLVFEYLLIPLLSIGLGVLIKYINLKRETAKKETDDKTAQKYIDLLADTIVECVIATNQTYVDALKDKYAFDEAAQKEAFRRTFDAIMAILSEEAKAHLTEIYGDLNLYITNRIEAEVLKQK